MNGYALVEKTTGTHLVTYTHMPNRLSLPSNPDGALVMGDDLTGWEDDSYQLVSVTLPDPPMPTDPTPTEKLANLGLTVSDLKQLLETP